MSSLKQMIMKKLITYTYRREVRTSDTREKIKQSEDKTKLLSTWLINSH